MNFQFSRRDQSMPRSTVLLLVLVATLALVLGVLLLYRFLLAPNANQNAPLVIYTESTEESPAEPSRTVVTPNGVPDSLYCKASYTAEQTEQAANQVAATWGEQKLTNAALQIYYRNAISTYRLDEDAVQPDDTQPLDEQLCPLEEDLSWQHYFLRQALDAWQNQQALLEGARQPRPVTEAAFKPNETDDLHGKYVAADLPVNQFLYQDQPCYKPNSMHQEYLDGLDTLMNTRAAELGYATLEDCAASVYGAWVTADDLVNAAKDYNLAYMFYTECSYDATVTSQEIADYVQEHAASLPKDSYTVDMRQVLLIPDGAKVKRDGTVTATEEQWEACRKNAEKMLYSWSISYLTSQDKEANFARMANENSADGGSQINGGSYRNVRPGQLIAPLDEWCFDPARKTQDTAVIRSELGYHIVYFSALHSDAETEAARLLTQQKLREQTEQYAAAHPMKADYSAVALWVDAKAPTVSPVDVLYEDVAHERFTEVMVYFQQDYMFSPYGSSYVGRGGCGITTMAMLATYMTDTILTPDMLAARYPQYHDANGTKGELFRYTTAEMGFYLQEITPDLDKVIAALDNGQRVISLQRKGHFTSGGHYLLLQKYYADDDTFQVRDSNIYNYGKLKGHQLDKFTRANIVSGGTHFYIMQKKITRIPACTRCGDACEQGAAEKMLNEDYTCEKCTAALTRRNGFLRLVGA